MCESASSADIVAQGSHVPSKRRGLDLDRSGGGSSKMTLVGTERQLSTDTTDVKKFKQDCRVRVPEFEVATESRPEELKPLAKARTVISEEKGGAESFSSGSHSHLFPSVVQASGVFAQAERLRRRSGTAQKACISSDWHSRYLVLLLPWWTPATRRTATKTFASAVRRRRHIFENSTKDMLPRWRYHWASSVALTKHRAEAQLAESR